MYGYSYTRDNGMNYCFENFIGNKTLTTYSWDEVAPYLPDNY